MARVGAIGIEMAVAIAIGFALGRYLDNRFQTTPTLTIILLLLGAAAGFRGLIRIATQERRYQERMKKEFPIESDDTDSDDANGPTAPTNNAPNNTNESR